MVYSVLLDAKEGNVVFHLLAHSVEKFGEYGLIVDGIEITVKDRIIDVIQDTEDVEDF